MKIRDDFLPLSRPALGEEEVAAVAESLRSGWITSGPRVAELEGIFREATGAPHAVAVTSATAGLHIVLSALGIGPGDEVVTPSMTFASTVNQIALRGATPVFADVDYGTLQVRPDALAARITPRTKAVIPVHFAGAPADLDPIRAAADRAGIPVIEDAAHAVGTVYKGVPAGGPPRPGAPGNIAIFSFHPIKNITTAEGGMVTCYDDALAARLRLLRFHGIERDAWKRYGKGGTPHYDIREPGYKYNLTDLHAAVGVVQMRKVAALNARRAELARRYFAGLEGVPGIDLPEAVPYAHAHSWHLFIVKVTGMDRDAFIGALAERNVGVGLHFPPCHLLSYVRERFGTREGDLPDTERAGKGIVSLPLFPGMSDADVDYVCEAVREILSGGRPMISVVVPVYNEEKNLLLLMDRLEAALRETGQPYEIIYVDDGSRDDSLEVLKGFIGRDGVRVLELTRNYGQHSAIISGFSVVRGDIVVTIDADLQNPPEEIPAIVRAMEEGNFEVVGTVREMRKDSIFRKIPSRIVNAMTRRITGIRMSDWGCMLRGVPARGGGPHGGEPGVLHVHPGPGDPLREADDGDPGRARGAARGGVQLQPVEAHEPPVRPAHLVLGVPPAGSPLHGDGDGVSRRRLRRAPGRDADLLRGRVGGERHLHPVRRPVLLRGGPLLRPRDHGAVHRPHLPRGPQAPALHDPKAARKINTMRAVVFAYHNMGIVGIRALLDHGFTIPLVLSHEDDPTGEPVVRFRGGVLPGAGDPGFLPEGRQRAAVAGPDPGGRARPALLLLLPVDVEEGDPRDPAAGRDEPPRVAASEVPGKGAGQLGAREGGDGNRGDPPLHDGEARRGGYRGPGGGSDRLRRHGAHAVREDGGGRLEAPRRPAAPDRERGDPAAPNDLAHGSYFGGRRPEDGRIDWSRPAVEIYNLVRAVTRPYPGAFAVRLRGKNSRCGGRSPCRAEAGSAAVSGNDPGFRRAVVRDGGRVRRPGFRTSAGCRRDGGRVASTGGNRMENADGEGGGDRRPARRRREREAFMKVLILGVNGFIGHHLTDRILKETDWKIYGMDLSADRLGKSASHPRFHFVEGDISINKEWIEYHVKKCDVVLPLVAIATPTVYVRTPARSSSSTSRRTCGSSGSA